MMESFCGYTKRLTIFTMKTPSQMFDWVQSSGNIEIFKGKLK